MDRTAPYMHNGVYHTLDEVMEFYMKGGTAGYSIYLLDQTLPTDLSNLPSKEKLAVIALMRALSDE